MSAITTSGVIAGIGAAASVGSVISANNASRRQADLQGQAIEGSRTQINPFSISGPGGMSASYGPAYQNPSQVPGAFFPTAPPGGSIGFSGPNPNVDPGLSGNFGGAFGGGYGSGFGPGGGGAFDPWGAGATGAGGGGNNIQLDAGQLEGPRSALSQFAGASVPSAGSGLPQGVQDALRGVYGAANQPLDLGIGGINQLQAGNALPYASALGRIGQLSGGYQTGLQNTAFAGAGQNLAEAAQGGQAAYDRTLATMRQQAQPFEQRQYNSLQNDLFGRGQSGTTGGGIQTEAFARGLGQADLSRQLAAGQEGRAFQQNALGVGQGLAGVGMGLAGQGNDLLQSAYGQFGQTSGIASDLNQQRFSRSVFGNEQLYGRAQQLLGNQTQLAGLPFQLQGMQLGNVNSALQGQAGIQQQLLQLYGAGLSTEQAASNARIGAGTNMAAIVGSPAFATSGYGTAAALGQMGQQFAPSGGYLSALQGLFQPKPVPTPGVVGTGTAP